MYTIQFIHLHDIISEITVSSQKEVEDYINAHNDIIDFDIFS